MNCLIHPKLKAAILKKADGPTVATCALVFVSQLFLKNAEHDEPTRFTPLQSRISRRIYTPRFYGPMLRLLDAVRAVERFRGGAYLANKVSKRYRLNPRFATGVESFSVDCPRLEERLEKLMTGYSYAAMTGRARKWILETYRNAGFIPDLEARLKAHDFKNHDAEACTRYHVQNIQAHRSRFYVCPDSRRVYYSVANLPKLIRGLLVVGGEPVVEIDLSASQPTLLATLYPAACEEKLRYLGFVQGGAFYEEIAQWAGKGWTRDETKTEFFNQIAYGSYYNADAYALLPIFKKQFPQLIGHMNDLKKKGNDVLPLKMQKLEADIAIYGACDECAKLKIPVLPVHDSLICKKTDEVRVREIFSRHWLAETGIPARMK